MQPCVCVSLLINRMEAAHWAVRARCEGWCIKRVLSVIASVAACLMGEQTDCLSGIKKKEFHRFDALTAILIFHFSSSPWPQLRTQRVALIRCKYQNQVCPSSQVGPCLLHWSNLCLSVQCPNTHRAFSSHTDPQLAKVWNHLWKHYTSLYCRHIWHAISKQLKRFSWIAYMVCQEWWRSCFSSVVWTGNVKLNATVVSSAGSALFHFSSPACLMILPPQQHVTDTHILLAVAQGFNTCSAQLSVSDITVRLGFCYLWDWFSGTKATCQGIRFLFSVKVTEKMVFTAIPHNVGFRPTVQRHEH